MKSLSRLKHILNDQPWQEVKCRRFRMNLRIIFSLILVCLYVCSSSAFGNYENCCLSYAKRVHVHAILKYVKYVKDYRMQEINDSCNKKAIIFYLQRRNRVICGDPREAWTKDLQRKIDVRKMNQIVRNRAY
ncbi:C-C motif chemokine 20-like isoform X2 [Rhinatrema bivittatum]|uniref:C-C motif chemokine 20-like isoform X2 n=1 Tax=Rhinatrema bivittatum TaxID=194408 RepID=UPI0011266A3C|nr:C-C motif chemokine 20-like isoform X2 [Rhinatrema bivittatum]XP_029466736.1 C-C motif chemokine 20-like isoform X2 [Rhinatrema bivittatum]